MKFVTKTVILSFYMILGQLCAMEYNELENGERLSSTVQAHHSVNTQSLELASGMSAVVQDRLSNCWLFARDHTPSLKKVIICGTGLTLSAGFAIGGYFLIDHALDRTNHNYWDSYLHCPKTHSGTSNCELAILSMSWGAIFETIAFAGFASIGYIWFGSHNID